MPQEPDVLELLDCTADERLWEADAALLPLDVARPVPMSPSSPARRRIVGVGATLTGVTLVAGAVLVVIGAIDVLADGWSLVASVALALGVLLVGTHWGWVHVAEITAQSIDARRDRVALEHRGDWLNAIKPYTRYEVATRVLEDGSIAIVRSRVDPVRCRPGTFTFRREVEHEEVHSDDESAAVVAERAEVLRREAALDTARVRERYQVAADAYQMQLLDRDDEQQRLAARRTAAAALSEQINTNLRDPPLIE